MSKASVELKELEVAGKGLEDSGDLKIFKERLRGTAHISMVIRREYMGFPLGNDGADDVSSVVKVMNARP